MPKCELCGGTEFVKEGDYFACQGCGTKYSLEDARRLMEVPSEASAEAPAEAPASLAATVAAATAAAGAAAREAAMDAARAAGWDDGSSEGGQVPVAAAGSVPIPTRAFEYKPAELDVVAVGPAAANEYVCAGWQLVLQEYQEREHPNEALQRQLAAKAVASMEVLHAAAQMEPNNHVANLALYENCLQIVEDVKDTRHYEQREDGSWASHFLPNDVKLAIPGAAQGLSACREAHREPLIREYVAAHPEEQQQRAALAEQETQVAAELADLKDEKKGHGLFDFSGKREVKERMAPVKEQLAELRRQIAALDKHAEDYVEECLQAASGKFRLLR